MGASCSCQDGCVTMDVMFAHSPRPNDYSERGLSKTIIKKTVTDHEWVTELELVSERKNQQAFTAEDICKIVRLQAMIKRYVRKIRLRLYKRHGSMNMKERHGSFKRVSKYLTEDNYFETLSEDKKVDLSWLINGLEPPLENKEYFYKSNASTYIGQWFSGFRHGKGKQTF